MMRLAAAIAQPFPSPLPSASLWLGRSCGWPEGSWRGERGEGNPTSGGSGAPPSPYHEGEGDVHNWAWRCCCG
jgi:hypothetical protein